MGDGSHSSHNSSNYIWLIKVIKQWNTDHERKSRTAGSNVPPTCPLQGSGMFQTSLWHKEYPTVDRAGGQGGGILIRGLGPERRREKHAGPPDQAGCLRIGATVQPGSWGFRVLRRRERSEIVLDSTCVRNVFRRETQRLSASPALPCSGQPTFLWLLGGLDECQVPQEGWRQAKRKVRMLFLCLPFGQQLSHRWRSILGSGTEFLPAPAVYSTPIVSCC